jgi:hypothetical protein
MASWRSGSWALVIAATVLGALSSPAFAAEKVKVSVAEVRGQIGSSIERAIVAALKKQSATVELVDSDAHVTIVGSASKKGSRWLVSIEARSPEKTLKTWNLKPQKAPKKLATQVERTLWKQLGPAITKARPKTPQIVAATEEPEEEPEETTPVRPQESEASASTGGAPTTAATTVTPAECGPDSPCPARNTSPLEAVAGISFFTRLLRYNQDIFNQLRSYSLSLAPAPFVSLNWYPGAHGSRDGFGAHIGVGGRFEHAVGLESRDETTGTRFTTRALAAEGHVRGRIPFSVHELVLFGGAGLQSFSLGAGDGGADPGVPDVNYTYLRFGFEGRLEPVDSLSITGRFAYRPVLSAGEITSEEWFRRGSAAGLDAGVAITYEVLPSFDMVLAGELRRYFYSFNPEPTDAQVAGGAVDQYLFFSLGIGVHL